MKCNIPNHIILFIHSRGVRLLNFMLRLLDRQTIWGRLSLLLPTILNSVHNPPLLRPICITDDKNGLTVFVLLTERKI